MWEQLWFLPQFKKLKYYDGFNLLQTSQRTQAKVNHLCFSNWSTKHTCWMPAMFVNTFKVSTIILTALGSQPLRIPVLCNWSLLETKSCVCQFRIFFASSTLPHNPSREMQQENDTYRSITILLLIKTTWKNPELYVSEIETTLFFMCHSNEPKDF